METEERRLKEVMAQLALPIKPEQEQLLLKYINLIIEGLSRQRLVGTRDSVEIIHKHIFDSLYPVTLNIFSPGEMLDLGTGAGLPGIPLKIMLSEQKIFFMDANRRKIVFLKKVCRELKWSRWFFLPAGLKSGPVILITGSVSRRLFAGLSLIQLFWPNWLYLWPNWEGKYFYIKAPVERMKLLRLNTRCACVGARLKEYIIIDFLLEKSEHWYACVK